METIPFSKLNLTRNDEKKTIKWNDLEIEVAQYLPVDSKLQLLTNVVYECLNQDPNYANPLKIELYGALEIAQFYTNINFEESDKNEPAATYDLLDSSGLLNMIVAAIPSAEYEYTINLIEESVASIYTYKNSAKGIMEDIAQNYQDMDFSAEEIKNKISDPENLSLLKDVLTKLG